MTEREAEHMDEVSNQFSYMKAMIDIQAATGSDVPIFSMITLGSKELPYFVTARAFGDLSVVTNTGSHIEIDHAPIAPPVYITSILYEAANSYFVDQTYALEGGGIIVDQPDGGSVMRVSPSISVLNESTAVTVTFDLPVFLSTPGKEINSGYGKCVIRTNYSHTVSLPTLPDISTIQIYTNFVQAWNESLTSIFNGAATGKEYTEYVDLTPYPGKKFVLKINEIYINAQIGPGWVI